MTTVHDALAQHVAAFVAAFADRDTDALDRLYEPDAVLVPRPGGPVTGAERLGANAYLMGLGLPMRAGLRRSYVAGDLALLLVDWSMEGRAPDGTEVRMGGTATDVVRRGVDGRWRYVIDNPFGAAA